MYHTLSLPQDSEASESGEGLSVFTRSHHLRELGLDDDLQLENSHSADALKQSSPCNTNSDSKHTSGSYSETLLSTDDQYPDPWVMEARTTTKPDVTFASKERRHDNNHLDDSSLLSERSHLETDSRILKARTIPEKTDPPTGARSITSAEQEWLKFKSEFTDTLVDSEQQIVKEESQLDGSGGLLGDSLREKLLINAITAMHSSRTDSNQVPNEQASHTTSTLSTKDDTKTANPQNCSSFVSSLGCSDGYEATDQLTSSSSADSDEQEVFDDSVPVAPASPSTRQKGLLSFNKLETIQEAELDRLDTK